MLLTIKELRELQKGNYDDVEIYEWCSNNHRVIHTDFIDYVDDRLDDEDLINVDAYQIYDEDGYNHSVNANCDNYDFEKIYGNKNAKILVIVLRSDWKDDLEELKESMYELTDELKDYINERVLNSDSEWDDGYFSRSSAMFIKYMLDKNYYMEDNEK